MPDSFEPGRDRDRDRDWDRDRDRGRKSRMTDDDRDRSRDRFRDESPEDHEGEPKSKMDRIFSQLKTMKVAIKKIPEDIKEATKAAEERANKHTDKQVGKEREELNKEALGRDKQIKAALRHLRPASSRTRTLLSHGQR